MNPTDLILENYPFPPFSIRECTQSLTLSETGPFRRTIDGKLVCLSPPTHRKFTSTITCQDNRSPGFEKMWIGAEIRVGCIQHLTLPIPYAMREVTLERDPVSCTLYDGCENLMKIEKEEGRKITLPLNFPGGFITYRPWLQMCLKAYHMETDEWGETVWWRLELVEI